MDNAVHLRRIQVAGDCLDCTGWRQHAGSISSLAERWCSLHLSHHYGLQPDTAGTAVQRI